MNRPRGGNRAADDTGFEYRGNVPSTPSKGREAVLIFERNRDAPKPRYEYRFMSISDVSALQNELREAGEEGFGLCTTVFDPLPGKGATVLLLERTRRDSRTRYDYQVRLIPNAWLVNELRSPPPDSRGNDKGRLAPALLGLAEARRHRHQSG